MNSDVCFPTSLLMSLFLVLVMCSLCVIAGNISPIDVITHVPILCEEASIPYVYVPSKEDLATAGTTKRPTCCVLVLTKPAKGELEEEIKEKLKTDYDQLTHSNSDGRGGDDQPCPSQQPDNLASCLWLYGFSSPNISSVS
ncbi:hypothetical protein GUJ93_ZPchr0012g19178 [Zizania palustris]|uniref:Ribosomal protein eL8/eL30/eS12/Gadd45 domain-containing protein n=1 Tax=Zizania palustris TaxID=103762 RepID=A0A8J6BRY8_ZIZPA|nr:hypothetical protein GUJ93_ZPchr0012g19178 [Zizania palustris]